MNLSSLSLPLTLHLGPCRLYSSDVSSYSTLPVPLGLCLSCGPFALQFTPSWFFTVNLAVNPPMTTRHVSHIKVLRLQANDSWVLTYCRRIKLRLTSRPSSVHHRSSPFPVLSFERRRSYLPSIRKTVLTHFFVRSSTNSGLSTNLLHPISRLYLLVLCWGMETLFHGLCLDKILSTLPQTAHTPPSLCLSLLSFSKSKRMLPCRGGPDWPSINSLYRDGEVDWRVISLLQSDLWMLNLRRGYLHPVRFGWDRLTQRDVSSL